MDGVRIAISQGNVNLMKREFHFQSFAEFLFKYLSFLVKQLFFFFFLQDTEDVYESIEE